MKKLRRGFKLLVFALTPLLALTVAAEAALRVKYFISNNRDWSYLITPIGGRAGTAAHATIWTYVKTATAAASPSPPGAQPALPAVAPASPAVGSPATVAARARREEATAAPAAAAVSPAAPAPASAPVPQAPAQAAQPPQQLVFRWQKPCVDQVVHSAELGKDLPRTWDDNCFRGDRVKKEKPGDEYRIFVVGGSTVEDAQSDEEMWTAQLKRRLPTGHAGKKVTVVNAGKAGYESHRIYLYWVYTLAAFAPDLVVYYEAWNEQPTDVKFTHADDRIYAARDWLQNLLFYRSMLYTYAVEKAAFMRAAKDRFWRTDTTKVRKGFTQVKAAIKPNATLVFVTQVIKFPRMWKGVDTFDYGAVSALLDRLRADRSYAYDVTEISALNQRMTLGYELEMCREFDIPVINILDQIEALGDAGRAEMFTDLGHLTPKGDRIVGALVAEGLKLPD